MNEEIRKEEVGQNLAVGESSVMLQNEFEIEAATSGISLFVLLTAINYNLAIKCLTGGYLLRVSMTWKMMKSTESLFFHMFYKLMKSLNLRIVLTHSS